MADTTKVIRVKTRTARLLAGFNKKSYDAAIWFLWKRICDKKMSGGNKMKFETKFSKTASGAKIRVDVWNFTCGWANPDTGMICQNPSKKFLYAEFKDPSSNICRVAEIFCTHLASYWTEEMVIDLIDLINAKRNFKDIDSVLRQKYPQAPWADAIIKRRANGEYKEFDCPAKKKYEDLKCNRVTEDVWKNMKCIEAYSKIDWPMKRNRGFDKTKAEIEALEKECVCGHEMFFHNAGGFCAECKKYCEHQL